jgi:hypothetical protein
MSHWWVGAIVSLALVGSLAITPAEAQSRGPGLRGGSGFNGAHGFQDGFGRAMVHKGPDRTQRFGHGSFAHQKFGHGGFISNSFVARSAFPFRHYAPPVVVYGYPGYFEDRGYYPSAYYDSPPIYYYPPVSRQVTMTSAPPPMPSVIEYPTGRYELRGDGATTPYTWVWIPNPPAAPPPPPTPPANGPSPSARPTEPAPSPSVLYRWTDGEGVVHWTDNSNTVPARYRAEATRPRSSVR